MRVRRFSARKYVHSLRRIPQRLRRYLSEYRYFTYIAIIGPGIIAANAGNDAGGIATYSSVGAGFGYTLLWTFIPMTVSLIVVQEMSMRMGIVTGQGLADLIREQFGVRWTAFVMLALLVANTGVIISEFVGIGQASELLGLTRFAAIPVTGVLIWWLVVKGSQKRVEGVFLVMSLVFFTYVISAFISKPDWSEVAVNFVRPTFKLDTAYLFTVMALIGTTIAPFMQIYVQSAAVEKGLDKGDMTVARMDVIVGMTFADIIAAFIVICTSATLFTHGITDIDSAATAAESLAPIAGTYAKYLFAIGLFGASMLAMGVVPLATAYSLSEALGFEKGLSRSFREAPIFLGIFTALILVGGIVAMIPGIPPITLLLVAQCVNGILLPVLLFAIVKLANDPVIMGEYRNTRTFNILAYLTAIVVSVLSVLLIGKTIADMF
jgi:Mn2+/Fe2+ NRAMP family transporter